MVTKTHKLFSFIFATAAVVCFSSSVTIAAQPANFGRSSQSLFNAGGFFKNGVLDLSGGTSTDVNNFSRISIGRNVPAAVKNRQLDIRDGNSGLVTQQAQLQNNGVFATRFANVFSQPLSNFSFLRPLDNEALRQASSQTINNTAFGNPNDPFAVLEAAQNRNNLANLIIDRVAANNLAMRNLSPKNRTGVGEFQCQKDSGDGKPLDFLAASMNTKDTPLREYQGKTWQERCVMLVSAALNAVVPLGKPLIKVTPNMINSATGIITVPNLGKQFSVRQFATLIGKQDNTTGLCNADNPNSNPIPSVEHLVIQASTPEVVNSILYNGDDVSRNVLANTGVNLLLPNQVRQTQGRTDEYFIDNAQSGVATAGGGQSRKVEVYKNQIRDGGRLKNRTLYFTWDSNAGQTGSKVASQNVSQTGRNNPGVAQGEGFMEEDDVAANGTPYTRRISFLMASPAQVVVNNQEVTRAKVAAEAPHSAASAGTTVFTGQCERCHDSGPNGPFNKYTAQDVKNATSNQKLSATFANSLVGYQNYLKLTDQYVLADKDPKDPNAPQRPRAVLWDAYKKAAMTTRSPAITALMLGAYPDQLNQAIARDPELQKGRDDKGDFNPSWLRAGGACRIKKDLAALAKAAPAPLAPAPAAPAAAPRPAADQNTHL